MSGYNYMKKIIITERAKNILAEEILKESYADKVESIKMFLDKNFIRATYTGEDENGELKNIGIVVQLDGNGQPSKRSMTDVQLFYLIQNKFLNILPKDKGRDGFLKQVLKDWYNNKITKNGSLSGYDF